MIQNNYGQLVFNETDMVELIMQGHDVFAMKNIIVDHTVNTDSLSGMLDVLPDFKQPAEHISVQDFHSLQQNNWHMPQEYQDLDIAAHVLNLCKTQKELQRCGQELMLYQEKNLFDLLKYLKYLVDVMNQNQIIWGVGRGSSVASYVLYLLGVHRIDSLYYNLDIAEFLR